MNMRISISGPVGDTPNAGPSNRLQGKSGYANAPGAAPTLDFHSIQQSVNAIKASLTAASAAPSSLATASSSTTVVPTANGTSALTAAGYPPQTIKSIYGEAPAGLNRSGLSGIIDKSGHNLSNQEIANFFDGNPTTQEISEMGLSLGLNTYQQTRALAVWRGDTFNTPIWAPAGASTIGGSAGGGSIDGGTPESAWGAWGNDSAILTTSNYRDTVTLASSSQTRNPTA